MCSGNGVLGALRPVATPIWVPGGGIMVKRPPLKNTSKYPASFLHTSSKFQQKSHPQLQLNRASVATMLCASGGASPATRGTSGTPLTFAPVAAPDMTVWDVGRAWSDVWSAVRVPAAAGQQAPP